MMPAMLPAGIQASHQHKGCRPPCLITPARCRLQLLGPLLRLLPKVVQLGAGLPRAVEAACAANPHAPYMTTTPANAWQHLTHFLGTLGSDIMLICETSADFPARSPGQLAARRAALH